VARYREVLGSTLAFHIAVIKKIIETLHAYRFLPIGQLLYYTGKLLVHMYEYVYPGLSPAGLIRFLFQQGLIFCFHFHYVINRCPKRLLYTFCGQIRIFGLVCTYFTLSLYHTPVISNFPLCIYYLHESV
jgi:hypothetical protein